MNWVLLESHDTESTHAVEIPGGVLVKVSDRVEGTLAVTFVPNCRIITGSCGEHGRLSPIM